MMANTSKGFRMALTGVLLFLTTPLTACHVAPEHQTAVSGTASVAMIVQQPKLFAGRPITIDAHFSGWKGNCSGPVPATRSDWMIEDGGACLYVNGPVPPGFSAAPPTHGIGEKITVSGTIELTPGGMPYLRLSR
jgi:hypothetical protein